MMRHDVGAAGASVVKGGLFLCTFHVRKEEAKPAQTAVPSPSPPLLMIFLSDTSTANRNSTVLHLILVAWYRLSMNVLASANLQGPVLSWTVPLACTLPLMFCDKVAPRWTDRDYVGLRIRLSYCMVGWSERRPAVLPQRGAPS